MVSVPMTLHLTERHTNHGWHNTHDQFSGTFLDHPKLPASGVNYAIPVQRCQDVAAIMSVKPLLAWSNG